MIGKGWLRRASLPTEGQPSIGCEKEARRISPVEVWVRPLTERCAIGRAKEHEAAQPKPMCSKRSSTRIGAERGVVERGKRKRAIHNP